MINYKNQRVGVFIDVQNMYYSARNLYNSKVNFGRIVKDVVDDRQLIRALAYVVSTKEGDNQPFFDALASLGIETKEKELMEYYGGQKKADWDVGITVDAISMCDSLDVIVLISGDGDYVPLVEYLRSRGKIVEVASFRETTSTRLIESVNLDRYINLSEDKSSYLIGIQKKHGGYLKHSKPKSIESVTRASKSHSGIPIDGLEIIDENTLSKSALRSPVSLKVESEKAVLKKSVVKRTPRKVVKKPVKKTLAKSPKKIAKKTVKSSVKKRPLKTAPRRVSAKRRKKKTDDSDFGLSANEVALNN